jgi:hypothetical protein
MALTVVWRATETARKIPAFSAVLSRADLRAAEPNDWPAAFTWAVKPSMDAAWLLITPLPSSRVLK